MWSLQEAKNRFSAVVDAALAGEPQEVSRRGQPAVVVLSAKDYNRLKADAVAARGTFAAHLLAFPSRGDEDFLEAPRPQATPREVEF